MYEWLDLNQTLNRIQAKKWKIQRSPNIANARYNMLTVYFTYNAPHVHCMDN